jgi:hypothetical protein
MQCSSRRTKYTEHEIMKQEETWRSLQPPPPEKERKLHFSYITYFLLNLVLFSHVVSLCPVRCISTTTVAALAKSKCVLRILVTSQITNDNANTAKGQRTITTEGTR